MVNSGTYLLLLLIGTVTIISALPYPGDHHEHTHFVIHVPHHVHKHHHTHTKKIYIPVKSHDDHKHQEHDDW